MALQDFHIPNWLIMVLVAWIILSFIIGVWYLWQFWYDLRLAKRLPLSPESHYLDIDGIRVYYEDWGKGSRSVLLLHGIGASSFTWRLLAPLLAKKYRVLCLDLPGFGRSQKDPGRKHDLDEQSDIASLFLTQLGVKKAYLVGSSMGGAIALWMAKMHPERFDKICVIAPAVSSQLLPIELARLSKLMLPTTSLFINKIFIKTILKRVVSKHDLIIEDMVRQYQRPYIEEPNSVKTFIRATSIISDKRLPSELKGLSSKVLILYGSQDKLVPYAVMKQLQSVLPNAEYCENEKAGHHPMEDDPEWVNEKLTQFFN